jgi:DNA (cytosine-5)-methyltransferase 1
MFGVGRPWDAAVYLPCADGKARPVESSIKPLVDGLPKGVVRGGDKGVAFDADNTAQGRVMRLKGYGNAIVPQLAAIFITALMENT